MLDSVNYEYLNMLPYWEKLDDLYRGEDYVKKAGVKYLPPSAGMILDDMSSINSLGFKIYKSYIGRADYL